LISEWRFWGLLKDESRKSMFWSLRRQRSSIQYIFLKQWRDAEQRPKDRLPKPILSRSRKHFSTRRYWWAERGHMIDLTVRFRKIWSRSFACQIMTTIQVFSPSRVVNKIQDGCLRCEICIGDFANWSHWYLATSLPVCLFSGSLQYDDCRGHWTTVSGVDMVENGQCRFYIAWLKSRKS
jgi:hypothetical protein